MKTKLLLCFLGSFGSYTLAQLPTLTWNTYVVKDPVQSPGFLEVKDINADGKLDIVMSTLMEQGSAANQATTKGAIRHFQYNAQNGISGPWTETMVLPLTSNLPFINHPQVMDVDGDGVQDILVQQGFINTQGGSHSWLKGPSFTQKFDFSPNTTHGSTSFFWHESVQIDLDLDGKKDIVTTSANNEVSPVQKKIEYYRNLGNGNFQHYILNDSLGGVFIKNFDVDQDGDQDIVVSQFFGAPNAPALVWLENTQAPSAANGYLGQWNYHVIDHTTGLGYYLDFYDIDMDGQKELIYGNHNNLDNTAAPLISGVYYFEIPANPATSSQWTKKTISEGYPIDAFDFGNPSSQGSPGIFDIGDIDGNGYPDVVLPGDGADHLFLIRQTSTGTWVKEQIASGRMFGMAKMVDIDQNGDLEIVATMHDFPEIWEILTPPAGHIKIYDPVIPLGIAETSLLSWSVYPNPSNESVTIKGLENLEVYQLRVVDNQGRMVQQFMGQPEIGCTLSFTHQGIYHILMDTKAGQQVQKVIIQ